MLALVVNDLLDGARSLGELDVSRELRRRGMPAPDRQVLRKDKKNRYYLDLYWHEYGLVVEIDGIHHAWAQNIVGDALRQNSLVISGDVVLRLPLLGLRLQPDDFFDQIGEALDRPGLDRRRLIRRTSHNVIRIEVVYATIRMTLSAVPQSNSSLSQDSLRFFWYLPGLV